MEPKPAFLGPQTASVFQEASVIEAYPRRVPYPESLFQKLSELLTGTSRAVLDVGTGPGDVARRLAPSVERVDAVDWSAGMIALGKQLPGGDDQRIHWIQGRVEEVALHPPYGLITAGDSLHWMDWSVVLPRFGTLLEPGASLAILTRAPHDVPWHEPLTPVFRRYSTIAGYRPYIADNCRYEVVEELESRDLFRAVGRWRSEPICFAQSVADYVEALHSMSGFARERMAPTAISAFGEEVRAILSAHADTEGILHMQMVGTVEWGMPLVGA
jgi:SAM-dependent methyltransferase